MQKFSDSVAVAGSDSVLRPLSGATVTVYVYGGAAATIYSDNGITTQTNPITTDSTGGFSFYAADGRYTLTIAKTGIETYTRSDVLIEDPVDDSASQIGFTPYGTSAVDTTVQKKLREIVTPHDFMSADQRADVESGTGSLDVSTAFVLALATGRPLHVPGGSLRKYKIGGTITVPSGAYISGDDSLLVLSNSVNGNVFTLASGSDNIEISGLRINCNKANNTSGNGIGCSTNGVTNVRIHDNLIYSAFSAGIYLNGATINKITVSNNRVYSCGTGGITGDDTISEFSFNNNMCWLNGTHGVGILGIGLRGTISDNICFDNGQGSPTADNYTGYNNSNRDLIISNNVSYGGLNNGIHFGGNNLTVTGNMVLSAAQNGIYIAPASGTVTGIVVSNNVVRGSTLQGIRVIGALSGSITGNTSESNTQDGIGLDLCQKLAISNNTLRANTRDGLRTTDASSYLTITSNEATGNTGIGLNIAEISASIISHNIVTGNTSYGIYAGGAEGTNIVGLNKVSSNTAGQIGTLAATTVLFGNDTGNGTGQVGASSIVGGYGTSSTLTLQPTSGVGNSTSRINFNVGNNGATTAMVMHNDGKSVFGGTDLGVGKVTINVSSGTDALSIMNSSLTSRGWEWYPTTNGAETDLTLYEFATSSGARATYKTGGYFGYGVTSPTAVIHLKAGTATASTSPLKFTSGTNLTTAEAGAMEYNGTNLFFTRSGTTREGVLTQSAVTTEVVISDTTISVNIGGTTYKLLARA